MSHMHSLLACIHVLQSILNQNKKKRHMQFSIYFCKSILFSDFNKYFYYGTDIRLPEALICISISTNCRKISQLILNVRNRFENAKCESHFIFAWSFLGLHNLSDTLWILSNFTDSFYKKQLQSFITQQLSPLQWKIWHFI